MKRLLVLLIFIAVNFHVYSNEIDFPPELLWWLNEAKKANKEIELENFVLEKQETNRFNANNRTLSGHLMAYPLFMRWNFAGNFVAYYDFNYTSLRLQNSGKYKVFAIAAESNLVIADKNKSVFFHDPFKPGAGIDTYYWPNDTILATVGTAKNEEAIDLVIKIYTVNSQSKTVEIKTYVYKNAFSAEARKNLKMKWIEQRADDFEFDL